MKSIRAEIKNQSNTPYGSWKRILLWGILLLLLLYNFGGGSQPFENLFPLYDFLEYWSAVRVFIDGGNPYGAADLLEIQKNVGWTDREALMMWNPPWVLPLLIPLYFIPFQVARLVWFLLNGTLMVCAADYFWRSYGGPLNRRWMSWITVLLFLPALQSLVLGQINPLTLFGLWGFVWALNKNRFWESGAFIVLISIKPHLLYLFWPLWALWIFKTRKWSVLLGATGSLAFLIVIVLIMNPTAIVNYWHSFSSNSGPNIWQTPSWGIALQLLFGTSKIWIRFLPSMLGLIAALLLWKRYGGQVPLEGWSIQIPLLSLITCSFSWTHDWVALLPLTVYLVTWYQCHPSSRWWIILALISAQPTLAYSLGSGQSNLYGIWYPPFFMGLYLLAVGYARFLNPKLNNRSESHLA